MLNKISLKSKIILATTITVLTFIGLSIIVILSIKYIDRLDSTLLKIETIQKDVTLLRNSEKNFIERKNLIYRLEFESFVNIIYEDINKLKLDLISYDIDVKDLQAYDDKIRLYDELFSLIVKKQKEIGFNENDGLYGELRKKIHVVEDYAKSTVNIDLLAKVYELRKEEKDFMLRRNLNYVERFKEKIEKLLYDNNLDEQYKNQLVEYKNSFLSLVEKEVKLGLTFDLGMYGDMRKHINESVEYQKHLSNSLSNLITKKIFYIEILTFVFCFFMVVTIIVFAISITKNIFNPLSKLLDYYKSVVDEATIVSKADSRGIITYVNRQFCEISGYEEEELIGKPHNIVRHPDTPKSTFKEVWETIKENKQTWRGTLKNRKKDGSSYWVKSVIKPILDVDGKIIEFIAIRTDITELEENKEHLKQQYSISSEKYEDVVRIANYYEEVMDRSSIVIRISRDFKINYVNDNFCKLTGYTKDELVNQPYSKLQLDYSEKEAKRMFADCDRFGIWKGQLKGFTKEGEIIYFTTTIFPIKDKNFVTIEYMAIRNDITKIIELHTELEDTQREIIYKMGEIAESRSNETGQHVKRVAEYSKLLALKLGLGEDEANVLKFASPMHDLGKVAIPDSILNKPAKLTSEEFEIMKTHAEIGFQVLNNSSRKILKAAAIVAYEHHEKCDGTGYPRGLKGNEIHIYGRITAIADVFDALAHDRIYKKAWELEDILNLFKEQKGKQFDPNLIDVFFENLDEFLDIKEQLS